MKTSEIFAAALIILLTAGTMTPLSHVSYRESVAISDNGGRGFDSREVNLTLNIVGSNGKPVEHAQVILLSGSGKSYFEHSDDNGHAVLDIPQGTYNITVNWLGQQVYEGTLQASDKAKEHYINCSVFEVIINTLDKAGSPYSDVVVSLHASWALIARDKSSNGSVAFRVPGGTYRLKMDVKGIYNKAMDLPVDSDMNQDIYLDIYPAILKLQDASGSPLPSANIIIYDRKGHTLNGFTDGNGIFSCRLPVGTYGVDSYWNGDLLMESNLSVDSAVDMTYNLPIFRLSVKAVDSLENPVGNANVYLYDDGPVSVAAGRTDGNGEVEFILQRASYSLEISWMNELVYSTSFYLKDNLSVDAAVDIHYLTVSVKGREKKELGSSFVTIKDKDGNRITGDKTNLRGLTTFRLPGGNYSLEVTYRGEYMMTDVDLGTEKNIDLRSTRKVEATIEDYPPTVWSTNFFTVLIGFLGMLIVLLIPLLHLRKTLKKTGGKKETEEKEAGE